MYFQDLKHDAMKYAKDWREKAITVHFTFPVYYIGFNDTVHVQSGIAGQLGRKVLRAAGLIGDNEGLVP